MQDVNVTLHHQANMTSLVTLQIISNDILLIEKIESKCFCVKKKLSVYSKCRVALLHPIPTLDVYIHKQSKKISNDQELIQSDPTSCPQNQKGNN